MSNKTLFISDLDGTLLTSSESLSQFTKNGIEELKKRGVCFTFATARSIVTTKKVIGDLKVNIPMILHNGAFVVDSVTEKKVIENLFDEKESEMLLDDLLKGDINPIVYTLIDEKEQFLYIESKINSFTKEFIASRKNDIRRHPVNDESEMFQGKRYYFTCIDEKEKLLPFYEKYKDKFHLIFARDFYSGDWWLEFLPKESNKASAALKLKKLLGFDKLVAFGDGVNDIELFTVADECYAVENADERLKKIATKVIGHHDDDSVIKWLLANT